MGIYDRDYYRKEGPSYLGSILERGNVCKWLVGINVVFFILQMLTREGPTHGFGGGDGFFTDALILNVDLVMKGEVWRLLTYAFLHDTQSLLHIVFNMLILWWFGREVEDLYGSREFLAFYLMAAVAGGVLYTLTEKLTLPPHHAALGASGAVTAVLVLFAIHYPTRVIYVMFVLPVPIWIFVIGSVVWDTYHWLSRNHSGVAVAAHLGGAAFALAYYNAGIRVTNLLPSFRDWKGKRNQPRLRVYREEADDDQRIQTVGVTAGAPPTSLLDDEQLEAKMDAVLEKISRVGKENLTESEREVLLRASELLKKRRN
jgi:membrane associated rhomboid family serine protease